MKRKREAEKRKVQRNADAYDETRKKRELYKQKKEIERKLHLGQSFGQGGGGAAGSGLTRGKWVGEMVGEMVGERKGESSKG